MNIYKYFPVASDRMGIIWTLSSIKDSYIIEFGPSGTTHYAVESIGQLNGEDFSNIYSTHMSESDITFGKYDRLEKSIKEVDLNKKPKYIFVMASSISSIIGTDIEAICEEIQNEVNARLIPIKTGGLKADYNSGVEEALELIVKNIVKDSSIKSNKVNIIGCNIDVYNFLSDCNEIKRLMKELFDKDINTVFTSYTSIDYIEKAAEAELNIVLRKEGLKAAEYMKKKFNIPYIYGKPIGLENTISWIKEVQALMNYDLKEDILNEEIQAVRQYIFRLKMRLRSLKFNDVAIFGDYDTVYNLKKFAVELGLNVVRAEVLYNCNIEEEDIFKNTGELNRMLFLKNNNVDILFGDGPSLHMESRAKIKVQVSNPNLKSINIYPYTPYVGFRGALLLIEKLLSK